jgi:hypothetical protein
MIYKIQSKESEYVVKYFGNKQLLSVPMDLATVIFKFPKANSCFKSFQKLKNIHCGVIFNNIDELWIYTVS